MDDTKRTAAAYRAVLHVNALDARKRTRFWTPECDAALAQAEATIAATPGRVLLEVLRRLHAGGPQAHDPVGVPMTTTKERSQRPRHGDDGLYDRADMRARRF
jgi:hypothetical protein